jgi:capsule polysaccharide export protein KpsE/RkpR
LPENTDIDHVYRVIDKLDEAITKLADLSSDIKQILAVHETRLDQNENIMERHFVQMDAIHQRVSSLRDDMNTAHAEVLGEIGLLQQWKWMVMGGAMALSSGIALFGQYMH